MGLTLEMDFFMMVDMYLLYWKQDIKMSGHRLLIDGWGSGAKGLFLIKDGFHLVPRVCNTLKVSLHTFCCYANVDWLLHHSAVFSNCRVGACQTCWACCPSHTPILNPDWLFWQPQLCLFLTGMSQYPYHEIPYSVYHGSKQNYPCTSTHIVLECAQNNSDHFAFTWEIQKAEHQRTRICRKIVTFLL